MIDLKLKLPSDFLKEEIRCGYTVTEKMKKVWAVELDLLNEFQNVCKKNNIKYFASGGTMLGAVRHKGFIPWDDDIDLMMMRADYEKLCQVAETEFSYPYFFQTEFTDKGSLRGHAVLKNSATTGAMKSEIGFCKFNLGIGIDIFPLDSVIDDEALFEKQCREALRLKKKINYLASLTDRYNPKDGNFGKKVLKKILHIGYLGILKPFADYDRLYRNFEKCCMRYNDCNTTLISTLSFQFNNKQHFKYRADYENLIEVPFEFMNIPIGSNYDHALIQRYGNYKKYEIGTACHQDMIYDVDIPYKEYAIKFNSEEKRR